MTIQSDLIAAIGDVHRLFGEQITIDSWTGTATVNGGSLNSSFVTGGEYLQSDFSIIVRKVDLNGFIPQIGHTVVARGRNLRIPPDGITDNRVHYRIAVVARDAPSR